MVIAFLFYMHTKEAWGFVLW